MQQTCVYPLFQLQVLATEALQANVDLTHHGAGSKFVDESLRSLCHRGAKLLRLDAFGYVTKKPGTPCFFEVRGVPNVESNDAHLLVAMQPWQ